MRKFTAIALAVTLLFSAASPVTLACPPPADAGDAQHGAADMDMAHPCAGAEKAPPPMDCCDDDTGSTAPCADCSCAAMSSPSGAFNAIGPIACVACAGAAQAGSPLPPPDQPPTHLLRPPIAA